jgi:glutaminyl-tRNA synthetase
MGVLRPLRVVIDNYPEDLTEELEAQNHPTNPDMGTRKVPFSRVLYIEQEDFREDPPKKFFRLAPGREVRLRYAYYIKCERVIKDEKTGKIIELRCTYDPETKGGWSSDGRKVRGTLHWVSASHSIKAEVRLYDRQFITENPTGEKDGADFMNYLNPNSLEILTSCRVEPGLAGAKPERQNRKAAISLKGLAIFAWILSIRMRGDLYLTGQQLCVIHGQGLNKRRDKKKCNESL